MPLGQPSAAIHQFKDFLIAVVIIINVVQGYTFSDQFSRSILDHNDDDHHHDHNHDDVDDKIGGGLCPLGIGSKLVGYE